MGVQHEPILDFDKPLPSWYCLLMMIVLGSLIKIVIGGFDKTTHLSRTSRIIRIAGGGFWAA
jgi:hypothetical protein